MLPQSCFSLKTIWMTICTSQLNASPFLVFSKLNGVEGMPVATCWPALKHSWWPCVPRHLILGMDWHKQRFFFYNSIWCVHWDSVIELNLNWPDKTQTLLVAKWQQTGVGSWVQSGASRVGRGREGGGGCQAWGQTRRGECVRVGIVFGLYWAWWPGWLTGWTE